ncbi:MAG: sulfotransferase [Geodermatophilaceae bacterium]
MNDDIRRDGAVLVTGLPRSGTSWVGKMLEASDELVYVNEPLNPQHPPGRSPGILDATVTHRFQYICADNDDVWRRAFGDTLRLRYRLGAELRRNRAAGDLARLAKYASAFTLGRLRGRRALVDDPYALFSAAWFSRCLGATTIVLVRDPVAFVGSWKKLGWTIYFHELLEQPLLMRDLLADHAPTLRALVGSQDRLAKNAQLWNTAYDAVDRLRKADPNVHVRRYEDFTRAPEQAFREVYALAGLTWTDRVRRRVQAATTALGSADSSFAWNFSRGLSRTAYRPMTGQAALTSFRDRLSAAEIQRVRSLTRDVAEGFYPIDEQTRNGS